MISKEIYLGLKKVYLIGLREIVLNHRNRLRKKPRRKEEVKPIVTKIRDPFM